MTGAVTDQETTEAIAIAARWLAASWELVPQPHTKIIREAYGLSFNDALKVIVEAKRIRAGGAT